MDSINLDSDKKKLDLTVHDDDYEDDGDVINILYPSRRDAEPKKMQINVIFSK